MKKIKIKREIKQKLRSNKNENFWRNLSKNKKLIKELDVESKLLSLKSKNYSSLLIPCSSHITFIKGGVFCSFRLFVCSVCLLFPFVCLFVCLFVLFIYLFVCSVCLFVCLFFLVPFLFCCHETWFIQSSLCSCVPVPLRASKKYSLQWKSGKNLSSWWKLKFYFAGEHV
jgi:hypothetical protein